MTFDYGDIIQCINAKYATGIKVGNLYTVITIDKDGDLKIMEDSNILPGVYMSSRFTLFENITIKLEKLGL